MKTPQYNTTWLLALLLWTGLGVAGYVWLLRYSFAAGPGGRAPQTIPAALNSPGARGRPQLFLALHPHCPCSRATLKELARILTQAPHAGDVTVLMFVPPTEPESWSDGALLKECRQMNCRIQRDPDGGLAASLGALTSGAVLLFDGKGRLRYHGGITAGRGHEGDNAGVQAVIEVLRGGNEANSSLPVFGCPIGRAPTQPVSL